MRSSSTSSIASPLPLTPTGRHTCLGVGVGVGVGVGPSPLPYTSRHTLPSYSHHATHPSRRRNPHRAAPAGHVPYLSPPQVRTFSVDGSIQMKSYLRLANPNPNPNPNPNRNPNPSQASRDLASHCEVRGEIPGRFRGDFGQFPARFRGDAHGLRSLWRYLPVAIRMAVRRAMLAVVVCTVAPYCGFPLVSRGATRTVQGREAMRGDIRSLTTALAAAHEEVSSYKVERRKREKKAE